MATKRYSSESHEAGSKHEASKEVAGSIKGGKLLVAIDLIPEGATWETEKGNRVIARAPQRWTRLSEDCRGPHGGRIMVSFAAIEEPAGSEIAGELAAVVKGLSPAQLAQLKALLK